MTLVEQLRSRKKALTVDELAGLLCIGIRTLYKEVEDNRIPFFRVRSSIRFDPYQIAPGGRNREEIAMASTQAGSRLGRSSLFFV